LVGLPYQQRVAQQPYQQQPYQQQPVAQQPYRTQSPQYGQQARPGQAPQPQAYAGSYQRPMVRPSRPFTVLARAPAAAPGMQPQPNAYIPVDEGPAWYEQWWVWTLLGLVTAGGITAGIILGLPAETSPPVGFSAGIRLE